MAMKTKYQCEICDQYYDNENVVCCTEKLKFRDLEMYYSDDDGAIVICGEVKINNIGYECFVFDKYGLRFNCGGTHHGNSRMKKLVANKLNKKLVRG